MLSFKEKSNETRLSWKVLVEDSRPASWSVVVLSSDVLKLDIVGLRDHVSLPWDDYDCTLKLPSLASQYTWLQ